MERQVRYPISAYPGTTLSYRLAQQVAHVVRNEGVMGGEPRIDGRRIAVRQIAERIEEGDRSAKTVADRYDLDIAECVGR
jgi:uncharacterized protein (DUF433 family)